MANITALKKESTPEQTSKTSRGCKTEKRTGNCSKHGEFEGDAFNLFGDKWKGPYCPMCMDEKDADRLREERAAESRRVAEVKARLLGNIGLPARFADARIPDYKPTCSDASAMFKIVSGYASKLKAVSSKGTSMCFCGKPGTGKTMLGCAVAVEATQRHVMSAKYTTVFAAMQKIKATYSKTSEQSESGAIAEFVDCGILILDEVGVQHGTDHEKIILYQIINGRYENMRPTVMISNLTETELTEYVGERVMDRMRENGGAVIPFAWASHRK